MDPVRPRHITAGEQSHLGIDADLRNKRHSVPIVISVIPNDLVSIVPIIAVTIAWVISCRISE
jgi:hypothetical protein